MPTLRAVIVTIAMAAALTPAVSLAAVTAPVGAPVIDECVDQIDNDDDYLTDDIDDGCEDDTPESEKLSQAALMGKYGARSAARSAADSVFGGVYKYGLFEQLKCRRRSRVSFWCAIGWYYSDYIYIARVRVFNYVDVAEDITETGYALRGWKLTMECVDRPNPARCATKRYHYGWP